MTTSHSCTQKKEEERHASGQTFSNAKVSISVETTTNYKAGVKIDG